MHPDSLYQEFINLRHLISQRSHILRLGASNVVHQWHLVPLPLRLGSHPERQEAPIVLSEAILSEANFPWSKGQSCWTGLCQGGVHTNVPHLSDASDTMFVTAFAGL